MPNFLIAHLLASVTETEAGCWEWNKGRDKQGYGHADTELAHRQMFRLAHGMTVDQLAGIVIRHRCDNPPCINPMHLEPGTQAQNIQDHLRRGRTKARSEAGGIQKLSGEVVAAMRRRNRSGEPVAALAAEYRVVPSAAYAAVRGTTWGWVEEPPVQRGGANLRVCACGNKFPVTRADRAYCSEICRAKAGARRQRERGYKKPIRS